MNTEIEKYYYERVEKRLEQLYGYFLSNCKSSKIAVLNVQLSDFKNRAKECGYILGMTTKIADGCDIVYPEKISFEITDKIAIKYGRKGNHKTGDKQRTKFISNIPDIKGYGMSLSLRGWHDFFGDKKFTYQKIIDKLELGFSIEEIFPVSKIEQAKRDEIKMGTTKIEYIDVDGKKLPTTEACKKCGINYTTLYKRLKKKNHKSRQEEFDSLRKHDFKKSNNSNSIRISDDDMNSLIEYANENNLKIKDALHKLIASVSY